VTNVEDVVEALLANSVEISLGDVHAFIDGELIELRHATTDPDAEFFQQVK